MRTTIAFLRDPFVHVILIALLLFRLAFLTGAEFDEDDIASCPFESCPICKLIRSDAVAHAKHFIRKPVAIASK